MTFTINIPIWAVLLLSVLIGINSAINVWHAFVLRQYTRANQTSHD